MKFRTLCLLVLVAVGQSAHIARRDTTFQDSDEDNEIGWNGGDDHMTEEDPEDFRPYNDYPDEDGEMGDKDGNFPGIFDEAPGDQDDKNEDRSDEDDKDGFPGDQDDKDEDRSDEDDKDGFPGDQGIRRPMPFGGGFGSFFDSPFFNLRQVREYFRELEKALARTFRQTLEEAKLLNGTYANTTEEEVVIGGKKFLVQKSIIKGGDNNSAIYIETLTSKTKGNGGINGMEVTSETKENVTTSR